MMRAPMRASAVLATIVALGGMPVPLSADDPVPLPQRAAGAQRVIVGTVLSVEPRFHRNAFGDQVIVSRVLLQVEDTLKGPLADFAWVDVEGGTLAGVTLRVSDMPELRAGERAVYFLGPAEQGVHTPHLRGQGILKLDARARVPGSSLDLDEIRRAVRAATGSR